MSDCQHRISQALTTYAGRCTQCDKSEVECLEAKLAESQTQLAEANKRVEDLEAKFTPRYVEKLEAENSGLQAQIAALKAILQSVLRESNQTHIREDVRSALSHVPATQPSPTAEKSSCNDATHLAAVEFAEGWKLAPKARTGDIDPPETLVMTKWPEDLIDSWKRFEATCREDVE